MKTYAPSYYHSFNCIASECRHNCCIGWEIDIDEDTYEYYKTVKGEFGKRLEKNIACSECKSFILDKNERCPFLNSRNLCDIIINLGEDKLCNICTDHPRFRNFYFDREEIGIGIACEAAARLVVGTTEKVTLIEISDDGEATTESNEDSEFRKFRDSVIELLQNREKTIDQRLDSALEYCGSAPIETDARSVASHFTDLEYMEEEWKTSLDSIISSQTLPPFPTEFQTSLEQLAVYFVYRHFPDGMLGDDIPGRMRFCALGVKMIQYLCALRLRQKGSLIIDDIAEAARMYSAQIEYSEENTERLIGEGAGFRN